MWLTLLRSADGPCGKDQAEPVQLVPDGSGIAPLMAMIPSGVATRSAAPFRLMYSARNPDVVTSR